MKFTKRILTIGLLLGTMGLVACGEKSSNNNGGKTGGDTKGPWTVTFDANGGTGTFETQTIAHKGLVTEPTAPTRTDEKGTYQFQGWRDGNALWSFKNSKVTKNTNLVASWLEKYAVSYQNADGTPNGTATYVDCGSALTAPSAPSAPAGQKFYGWVNVKNGGQVWNFENASLNKVMADTTLKPLFVSNVAEQKFEAELCPDFLDQKWGPKGMPGTTYSGGQGGLGLTGLEELDAQGKNTLGSSGNYTIGEKKYSGYVQFMYVEGDTLTWEIQSDAVATNVTLFMRISAEYGTPNETTGEVTNTFDDTEFKVIVNDADVKYGEITLRNIVQTLIPYQDYLLSTTISLKAGTNKIQMLVNNHKDVTSAIHAAVPCIDCIKLYSSSNLTWPGETLTNITNR